MQQYIKSMITKWYIFQFSYVAYSEICIRTQHLFWNIFSLPWPRSQMMLINLLEWFPLVLDQLEPGGPRYYLHTIRGGGTWQMAEKRGQTFQVEPGSLKCWVRIRVKYRWASMFWIWDPRKVNTILQMFLPSCISSRWYKISLIHVTMSVCRLDMARHLDLTLRLVVLQDVKMSSRTGRFWHPCSGGLLHQWNIS